MKYVFLGSGLIAKRCLQEALLSSDSGSALSGIVADANNLKLFENKPEVKKILISPNDKNEDSVLRLIREIEPNFIVSVQYPWILSSLVLDTVPSRAFNIHNAKLPEYRGHNTLTYEILNGEKVHTSTLHLMDKIVDRGALIREEHIEITPEETALSLWGKSLTSCMKLFKWLVLDRNYLNTNQYARRIVGQGRYYGKHQIKLDKKVPLGSDVDTLYRYARAFYYPPHEPAYLIAGSSKIYLTPEVEVMFNIKSITKDFS